MIIKLMHPIKDWRKTITFDNGKELAMHGKIADKLNCDTYFAHPYHSWERGQNENANNLLRQYFPKSIELTNVTHKLNSHPRKCLDFKTPYEAFEEATGIDLKTCL